MGAGIDYGMGLTNIDRANGIRYGVISQNDVGQAWFDSSESEYPDAEHDEDCDDHGMCSCGEQDEAIGFHYNGDGYMIEQSADDTDLFITASPFYTFARFCSPCAPGAGHLANPDPDGVKTYCLGHDWFEDGKAPYPVYRVEDDALVSASE